jgi:ATP-dependent DNA helicase Rep
MLNNQQMAAVRYTNGPLLVLAGAGSGKTRVITHKMAYLIQECGLAAPSIYAVTFTNKAANEMKGRVAAILPKSDRRGLKISTFHTLGLTMIKRHAAFCDLKNGFSVMDSEDCQQLLKGFLPTNKTRDKEFIAPILQHISLWKNELLSPEMVHSLAATGPYFEEAAQLYPRYQQALKTYNAVDFDDLIGLPVMLLEQHPEVAHYWANKIQYLLVDEYQDSNTSQYLLVKRLTGSAAKFTVVGDDYQSIYAWRGAKPEQLGQLHTDYPQLKMIKLEQNYRSTGRILHAANQLITHNTHLFPKTLWSELGSGDLLRVLLCKDEQDEAEQVIVDLIGHTLKAGTRYGDYAILYRGNHQSRVFEKVLRHYNIPYRISGGQSWFAKAEVKDILAYLKLLCNDADNASFLRVINTPKRGIGDSSLEALSTYAQSRHLSLYQGACHMALANYITEKPRAALYGFKRWFEAVKQRLIGGEVVAQLREMIEDSGYMAYVYEDSDTPAQAQKRMDNVWELIEWIGRLLAKKPEQTLSDVVNTLILIDILEQADEYDSNTLQLMTLHASKGLEFPYVYLVGMEEALLPHRESIEEGHIEEERRLAYVGVTRAQKGLCFSLAKQRRSKGALTDCLPSRFLDELPKDCLEWFGKHSERTEVESKQWAQTHLGQLKSMLGNVE